LAVRQHREGLQQIFQLGVVTLVGRARLDHQRDTVRVGQHVAFAPVLAPVYRRRAGVFPTFFRSNTAAIDDDPFQVEAGFRAEQVEQLDVSGRPNAPLGPLAEASPTGAAGGAVQRLARDLLPAAALAQNVEDATQAVLVLLARTAPLGVVVAWATGQVRLKR